jgi:aldehyde:ferredoxin oxidoreductase
MGSKNLKAIAVRGRKVVEVADRDAMKSHNQWMVSHWRDQLGQLHEHGSAGNVPILQQIGALPTRNHTENMFEGASSVSGQVMTETILESREGCFSCPVRCKRRVKIEQGAYKVDSDYGGPEYETVGAFGPNCGVDNLEAISKANEICNAYGIDTISAGSMIAFAMDCFENKIIDKDDTGGLVLNFGDAQVMVQLTEMIARREGFGDLLADGPQAFIDKYGPEARKKFVGVKNQALPMHESRVRHGHALGYAMSPTGADHMHNFWDVAMAMDPVSEDMQAMGDYQSAKETVLNERKVRAYTYGSSWSWIFNIIGCCMYIPWPKERMVNLINAITGWNTNMFELLLTCKRMVTMARLFNLSQGLGKNDDELPEIYYEDIGKYPGINRGDFTAGRELFYSLMGWDQENGIPLDHTLVDLDLKWENEVRC